MTKVYQKEVKDSFLAAERDAVEVLHWCHELLGVYADARAKEKMSVNRVSGISREVAELIKVLESCTCR